MNANDEHLNTLLQRFVDNATADAMAEDIRHGDAMIDRFPAPALSVDAQDRLRSRLRTAAAARRHHRLFLSFSGVAAAAMVMWVVFFGGSDISPPVQPEAKPVALAPAPVAPPVMRELPVYAFNLWDETFHADSEESYSAMRDELDNIAASIEAVRFKTLEFSGERLMNNGDELEHRDGSKLTTTDFWKG